YRRRGGGPAALPSAALHQLRAVPSGAQGPVRAARAGPDQRVARHQAFRLGRGLRLPTRVVVPLRARLTPANRDESLPQGRLRRALPLLTRRRLAAKTMRSSFLNSTNLNGPVPTGCWPKSVFTCSVYFGGTT